MALLKAKGETRKRLRYLLDKGESIGVSTVVLYELWYGVSKSDRQAENEERLRNFLSGPLSIIPFEEEDAFAAGKVRSTLESLGKPIGPYDILIASQALRLGATLVTENKSDFARVPGLTLENWH